MDCILTIILYPLTIARLSELLDVIRPYRKLRYAKTTFKCSTLKVAQVDHLNTQIRRMLGLAFFVVRKKYPYLTSGG